MNALRITSLAVVLLLTTSVDLFAQQELPVTPGDRVRVSRFGTVPPVICTLLAMKADTLVLDAADRVETLEVPLALVKKVEVSRGKKSSMGWGALAGGTIGAIIGFGMWQSNSDEGYISFGPEAVAIGGGVGMLLGTMIGAASSSDRWEEVPLSDIRVGLSPATPGGVAVSFSLRS